MKDIIEAQSAQLGQLNRIDEECQTDHQQQQEKLVYLNNQLKRTLEIIEDKIQRIVMERSDLFQQIEDDPIHRLDHLISTVNNQLTMIDVLQDERDSLKTNLCEKDDERQLIDQQLRNSEDQSQSLNDERDLLLEQLAEK